MQVVINPFLKIFDEKKKTQNILGFFLVIYLIAEKSFRQVCGNC